MTTLIMRVKQEFIPQTVASYSKMNYILQGAPVKLIDEIDPSVIHYVLTFTKE